MYLKNIKHYTENRSESLESLHNRLKQLPFVHNGDDGRLWIDLPCPQEKYIVPQLFLMKHPQGNPATPRSLGRSKYNAPPLSLHF